MPVTNLYDGNVPTYDADEDVWGFELNTALRDQIKPTLDSYATAINATETAATGALLRAGGTMTGDLLLADVAPSGALSAGFRGLPFISINADRTLLATDAGKSIRFFGTVGRTLTIPSDASVPLPVGTVCGARNYLSFSFPVTVTPAPGVTLTVAGSLAPVTSATVAAGGFATLVKEDPNIWFVSGTGVS